jgi:pseudouridine kinase
MNQPLSVAIEMAEEFTSTSPEAPALVIGAAGVDIVGRLRGELNLGSSNPAVIRSTFGGVARNVAENLARLGQPVRLVTAVGRDSAGELLLKQASEAGVDVTYALRTGDYPTGVYLAAVDARGTVQIAMDDMRAVNAITPEYLEEHSDLFDEASLLFLDANLSRRTLVRAISLARRSGLPICIDPTTKLLAQKLHPHLRKFTLVTPNIAEASVLCERDIDSKEFDQILDSAKCLVNQGVSIAIITLAEFGVCYATSQTNGKLPAIRTTIVDPTGGGDALTAAVIFGLLNDIPLDDAVRLGVSAATLTLQYPGAVVPDLTLQKLYDQLVI